MSRLLLLALACALGCGADRPGYCAGRIQGVSGLIDTDLGALQQACVLDQFTRRECEDAGAAFEPTSDEPGAGREFCLDRGLPVRCSPTLFVQFEEDCR